MRLGAKVSLATLSIHNDVNVSPRKLVLPQRRMLFHQGDFLFDYPVGERSARRFVLVVLAGLEDTGLNVEVWEFSHSYLTNANELVAKTLNWINLTFCLSLNQVKALREILISDHILVFLVCLHVI
jgi:hypothetical protein